MLLISQSNDKLFGKDYDHASKSYDTVKYLKSGSEYFNLSVKYIFIFAGPPLRSLYSPFSGLTLLEYL